MKRGVRRANFDTNKSLLQSYKKKDDQILGDKKRKPSKIEERLRMRKLHLSNMKKIKSPESAVIKSSNTNADDSSNSSDSSIEKTNSCSSTSSEYCNPYKIRDSKQRVDLLEVQGSDRLPINYILSKKPKGRSKINGEKISPFFLGRSKNFKARAKSAPCTPLFQIKYAKDNSNRINFGGGKNFSDYKNDGANSIGLTSATNHQTLVLDDEIINAQPIGNPALISVMTESIDKMRETSTVGKSRPAINNEECDEGIHREKSSCSNLNLNLNLPTNEPGSSSIIDEIGRNSAPQETEIPSKLSASLELRVNECTIEKCEELNANSEDKESNLESRNDNASEKSLEKCCNCKTEKNRVNIYNPKNFTEKETADDYSTLHQPTVDVNFIGDQRTESSCRSRNLQLQLNRREGCRPHGCNNICKNEMNDSGKIQISNADLNGCKKSTCCGNSIRNYIRPSSATLKETEPGTNRYSHQKRVCICKIDAGKFNCRSNFESKLEIRCGEDHSAVSIAEYDIPSLRIVQSPKMVTKCSSSSKTKPSCRGATRSCDYCNRTAAKCYPKVFAPRSKSTPRRVSFCLPSLIPEEEDSCSGPVADKTVDNYLQICKRGDTGYSGVKVSDQYSEELKNSEFLNSVLQGSKKPGRISRCNFHSHCGCNFHHKPRSPRVNVCRKIITNHQYIVRDDVNDIGEQSKAELPKNSESKTSVTSAKEWAVDSVEENMNYFNDVSFPKETRRAMNVLLQSRAGNPTTQLIHRGEISHVSIPGQKPHRNQQPLREVKLSKKPDFGIFDSERHKAMHVAKYAQALAMFQRACDPLQELGDRNSCKKKEHNIARKGMSDGEINSEYNCSSVGSEFVIQKIVERFNHKRIRNQYLSFLRNKFDPADYIKDNRTFNVPNKSTGLKMQTNGSDNGSSENGVDRTGWTVGLINGRFKYLTAETFGFKINANGASLKKKQLWTLEGSEHQVFLRSHLDRYLAVDQFGNVTCEAEDTADPGCAFQIQVASDGSGRWALKNIQRGYFLGSSQDELKCTAKVPGDAEYWLVHLAARPQVNLRSAGRKRFAHLSAAQDEIHVDAPVPWGEDTLFTLEFRPAAMPDNVDGNSDARREVRSEAGIGGHYALHTCNNKYLARDGKLLDSCTRDCLYAAEFHAGMLALRDVSGAYLAPIGSKAVLKSRSNTVTRDELFSLEDSLPQASFVAALNQRYVSVKQGVDVTANQDEISGHETFQLEFDRATKRWYLRTMQDRYWTLEAGGGIQASDHKRSSNALFDLIWQPADGTVALRANNGKFLATKRSGHLYANADSPGDSEASKFYFYLMNRPVLVLRCEQGFVGLKSNASPKLECNKASYETIRVERCDRGIVRFKGQNGKYWHADSEGVTSDADVPSDGFYLELREPSRICIKSTDGRYLSAGKNGVFRLGDTDYESATKWEF